MILLQKPLGSYRTVRREDIKEVNLSLKNTGSEGATLEIVMRDGEPEVFNIFNTTDSGPKGFRERDYRAALSSLTSIIGEFPDLRPLLDDLRDFGGDYL